MPPEIHGLNVHTFDASGDGSTDDSAAIQRALDAGHPRVVIPLGTYRIGRALRIGSNTQLIVHPPRPA